MSTLLAGWFSFEGMGATAGDLIVRDLVGQWLDEAGVAHDVATTPPFGEGVDWRQVDPERYQRLVFVCGPFGDGPPLDEFLERFRHAELVGLGLSLLQPLDEWHPFTLLVERDSDRAAHPDLSFGAAPRDLPVIGTVQVHPQEEYGDRGRHAVADAAIDRLLDAREVVRVTIDTRLDENSTGLRSAAEVETLIARVDAVITTRLHGLVLALRRGVPALVIDPIAGGAKVHRQATTIGWPIVFTADRLDAAQLESALDRCLTAEARALAVSCADTARQQVLRLKDQILGALAG